MPEEKPLKGVGENGDAARTKANSTGSPSKSPMKAGRGKMVMARVRLLDGSDWDVAIEVINIFKLKESIL